MAQDEGLAALALRRSLRWRCGFRTRFPADRGFEPWMH